MLPVQLHPFRPRLLDTLQGCIRQRFVTDVGCGATVGIVALPLPLALAFGIASGVKPEQGLLAVLIALSQLRDLMGLAIAEMPGKFFAQIELLAVHIGSFNPDAFAIGVASVAGLAFWPRL